VDDVGERLVRRWVTVATTVTRCIVDYVDAAGVPQEVVAEVKPAVDDDAISTLSCASSNTRKEKRGWKHKLGLKRKEVGRRRQSRLSDLYRVQVQLVTSPWPRSHLAASQ